MPALRVLPIYRRLNQWHVWLGWLAGVPLIVCALSMAMLFTRRRRRARR